VAKYRELKETEVRKLAREVAAEGAGEAAPPTNGSAASLEVNRAVAEYVWEESCTVCRLFGSLAIASRVRFPDLPLAGDLPLLDLRNGVGIDRDKGLAADGVLYDFEAVPPGTAFQLTVIVDNPDDADVGLLLYLFEEMNHGHLALGGKSSRGLGLVRVTWDEIVETSLEKENPFASMLSSLDLLQPRATEPEERETAAAPELPTTGDPAAWRVLADLLLELPEVDKTLLGQRAAERGLAKTQLNEKLGLGLDEKKVRKAWDVVIERLVGCGFIVEHGGRLLVAGRVAPQAQVEDLEKRQDHGPALQAVFDRYVGVMARLWEEAR
jgi:hypothetical protein